MTSGMSTEKLAGPSQVLSELEPIKIYMATAIFAIDESRVEQWKRAGPITQRSVDGNHALLIFADVR